MIQCVRFASTCVYICDVAHRGGYFHQNRTWMCLPDFENLTFSTPIFCVISHQSVYHFWKKSTQFWPIWVLLTIICPKYTQFMSFGLLSLWWKAPNHYTKFCEKAPQKAGTYTYTMSMWQPPQHIKRGDFASNVNFELSIWCTGAFAQL